MIKNKFYIWLVNFKWEYYKWSFKTFINEKLFSEANEIHQWLYEHKNTWIMYPFKWIIKDEKWLVLNAYIKKGHTYYKSQSKSPVNVNINEIKLIDKIGEVLKNYEMNWEFKELNKKMAFKLLEKWKSEERERLKAIESEIHKLETRKQNLIDLRLEWEIDREIYNSKLNDLTFKINSLNNQKKEISTRKDEAKIIKVVELACSLYNKYKQGNTEEKSDYLRDIKVELFINNKKELSYPENSLLNSLIFLQNIKKNVMETSNWASKLFTPSFLPLGKGRFFGVS